MLSSDKKTELAFYRYEPEGDARGMVQIVHGMCEYFGRYEEFVQFLAAHGFVVFGHDHLGHGQTAKSPEDLGFTVSGGGADALVDDVRIVSRYMKAEHPDLPLVLFGHSMGSFIIREALARFGEEYDAAIICGTGGPDSPTGIAKAITKTIMAFRGERHRSSFIPKLTNANYLKKYEKGCGKEAWLTRDESIVEKYAHDPLTQYTFTTRAYLDLFTLVAWVSDKKWAGKLPKKLPCLVVSGDMDPVGSWGKGPAAVADRMRKAGMEQVTLKLYPGMRHEILNEIGREDVRKDLLGWIEASAPLKS